MGTRSEDILPPGFRLHWYQIQALLGDGGFGVTYLGRDTNLNQTVAIKEYFPRAYAARTSDHRVRPRVNVDPRFFEWGIRRFLEEAQLLARFRHPNIVRVLSVFEHLGTAYMVMEMERGVSLSDAIKSGGLGCDRDVLDVCLPVLDGLQLVHKAGFIHRDIKPANILLRPDLGPVLIDFGSARQPYPDQCEELTAIVSRGYAPFEQYDAGNEDQQGPWTDIYGMAATLYHVVTGKVPSEALARGMALLNGDEDPLKPATGIGTGLYSAQLLSAIDAGIRFRASDRPQSIAAWLAVFPEHDVRRGTPEVRTEALDISSGELERRTSVVPDAAVDAANTAMDDSEQQALSTALLAGDCNVFSKRSFLVVDDEPAERSLARRVLERLGASEVALVDSASHAMAHMQSAKHRRPVVLCDLDMPSMDGLQLMREMSRHHLYFPVVLLGCDDSRLRSAAQTVAEGYGLPVLGSIAKPLSPSELSRVLASADGSSDHATSEVTAHHVSDEALREGVSGDAVELLYQPVVSLAERRLVAFEALVRWRSPRHGLILPADFLARVEFLELGEALTRTVIKKALADAGDWRSQGIGAGVAINLFPSSMQQLDLPSRLIELAQAQGVDPRIITLEVNEPGFIEAGGSPLEVLARLRLKGLALALDDFGTGSADLERLRAIPFTELKVHRSYVRDALHDTAAYAILESCVALARRMQMRAVAVGVENQTTWDMLERLGFDAAQGFLVSEPLKAGELGDWFTQWRRRLH